MTKTRHILISLASSQSSNRDFIRGLARYARRNSHWLVHFVNADGLNERTVASQLKGLPKPDGIIAKENVAHLLRRSFGDRTIPLAVFGIPDGHPAPDTAYFSVGGPSVGVAAARYFQTLGSFAAYGYYSISSTQSFVVERLRGYAGELATQGHAVSASHSYDDPEETKRWLAALPRPAAVFCACDFYAIRLLQLCRELDLAVPSQISVLGVDNEDMLSLFASPSLSTLQLPHEKLGELAAINLDKRLRSGRHSPRHSATISDCRVIERGSTAPLAPATQLIRRALDYISAHPTDTLTVEALAEHLGVSRKLLELRFRERGQGTIKDAILTTRLEHFRRQLRDSNQSIKTVAEACGFTNQPWLKTLFRQRYGETITDYRRRIPQGHN